MNPYESPPLLADEARYDRTLFWRVVKCSLLLLGFFVLLDIGILLLRPSVLGSQGTEDAVSFLSGHNGWLREQLDRLMSFLQ